MKGIMSLGLVLFINIACFGQDLTDMSMKTNDKLSHIKKQIDSLKSIQTSLEKELDSVKVIEFNRKKAIDPNETYVFRWPWKSFEEGERVEIVKPGDKWTIVNTALYKNVEMPSYYLMKENEFLISEKEKAEKLKIENKMQAEKKKKDQQNAIAKRIQAEKEEKIEIEKRKNSLFEKYGSEVGLKVFEKQIWIGMTKAMLIDSWGNPSDVNRSVGSWGVHEQCVFYGRFVYVQNEIVTSWQD